MVSIVERIFLVDWFLDFWGAPGQVPGFACVLCVRHPIFRGIRRMFPGSIGRALPLAQSVIRLAGAFPMVEMVLSGILSASVRILLLATPRRSPLRLWLGEKHAA